MQVHTFGHAPSRQIMVRASPDEPYQAVSPRAHAAGLPPAGLLGGVQQLPVVDPAPSQLVHYDKGSGMWVTDPAGTEADSEGSQEPRGLTLGATLATGSSPGQSTSNCRPCRLKACRRPGCLMCALCRLAFQGFGTSYAEPDCMMHFHDVDKRNRGCTVC